MCLVLGIWDLLGSWVLGFFHDILKSPMTAKRSAARASQPLSWAEFQSHVRYLPTAAQTKIQEAFELGAEVHGGQMRKSGEPYFSHPIAVANILADLGADANTIIAALLHDVLEDTSLSEDEIEERLGKTVLVMIDALTKLEAEDFSDQPSLDEQIETLRKLFNYMQKDARIMVIKLADRLHNMQTIEFLPKERRQSMAQETLDVYVKIADRLSMEDMRDELEELSLKIAEPELFAKLLALRTKSEKFAQQTIEEMQSKIRAFGPAFPVDLRYEHKDWRRLRTLLETEGSTVTGVSSLTAVFICDSIEMCYRTLGVIHQNWQRESLSFQDFINAPMINGYRGLHTTIIGSKHGTRILCKIRTRKMQEYARKGITTLCFDSEAAGVLDYLPWTKRISPLSEDTVDRSENFWQSLQSDLLGESILVHGIDDRQQLLPQGSTALDGAFYFYGEKALHLKTVKVNGKEVPFHEQLENAVALECSIGSRMAVSRDWLQWVHTGFAAAKIHEGLSRQPREEKIAMGKELLQEVMIEKRKGLLAEFEEKGMKPGILSLGFRSLDEGYIALAEGRVEPQGMYRAIFAPTNEKKKEDVHDAKVSRQHYAIHFRMQKDDVDALSRLVQVYGRYREWLGAIRILPIPLSPLRRFSVSAELTSEEIEAFKKELELASGVDVHVTQKSRAFWSRLALPLLIVLWGLDAFFGKILISAGVSPYDLTLLRFAMVFILSAALLLFSGDYSTKLKRLSPFNVDLFISSIAIFSTALFSYIALQSISSIAYALCMNLGIVMILAIAERKSFLRYSPIIHLSALGFFILTISFLILDTGSLLTVGSLAGIGACISFALYSIASDRYQHQEAVQTRYPFFVFNISAIALLLSLPLFSFTSFSLLTSSPLLWPSLLFVTILVAGPYLIYYQLMKLQGLRTLGRYVPLFLVVVVVAELLTKSISSWLVLMPVFLALVWMLGYTKIKHH